MNIGVRSRPSTTNSGPSASTGLFLGPSARTARSRKAVLFNGADIS